MCLDMPSTLYCDLQHVMLTLPLPPVLCPFSPYLQYLMLLEQLLREKRLRLQHLAGVLPPVHELIRDYKVAPGIAWALWRPVFQALQPALAAHLAVSTMKY